MCGNYDDDDFVAKDHCCACGGGTWISDVWTEEYIKQVPHGINPWTAHMDGIFFVDKTEFLGCFDEFQIAHYRDNEGYSDNWIDVEDGQSWYEDDFSMIINEKKGDLYFTVESYYYGMIPALC